MSIAMRKKFYIRRRIVYFGSPLDDFFIFENILRVPFSIPPGIVFSRNVFSSARTIPLLTSKWHERIEKVPLYPKMKVVAMVVRFLLGYCGLRVNKLWFFTPSIFSAAEEIEKCSLSLFLEHKKICLLLWWTFSISCFHLRYSNFKTWMKVFFL